MNQFAQALGRMAKGKPKNFTAEQKQAARKRLEIARTKRWTKKEVVNAV